MTNSRIGIIGLGAMGSAFAERFLECGIELVVHNRSDHTVARLAASGAVATSSAGQLAEGVSTIITMLPDGRDVQSVLEGDGGVFARATPGSLVIDCSTIAPAVSRQLARRATDRGLRFADAAVGGLPVDARAGRLSVMYGAEHADRSDVETALNPLARRFAYCGIPGTGVTTKLISNLLSNAVHVANLEALVIAERAGLDIGTVLEVLRSTAADNRQLHERIPAELTESAHEPGFKIELAVKDIRLGCALAAEYHVAAEVLPAAGHLLELARERGRGSLSVTALLPTLREIA